MTQTPNIAGRPAESVPLRVTAHMLGDWQIGSGAGRHGSVDRGVQRDDDGLPFVPAKTLVGVWRDACEKAARALDGSGSGSAWQAWVEFLFGSQPVLQERGVVSGDGTLGPPRPAALWVDSLHYPPVVRESVRGRPLLASAAVYIRPGVVIDPISGRAEDELLRMEERARGGVDLSGQAELNVSGAVLSEEQWACAGALLDAGARLLEALGGKRRRGAGRCRLEVAGLPADWRWLEGRAAPPLPDPGAAPEVLPVAPHRTDVDEEWEAAELRLVVRRPLVAHERTVGNSVRSAGRVAGRRLLPAVLEKLGSAELAAAARGGRLVITDATVEVDGAAGRPEPLALARTKQVPGRPVNLLQELPTEAVEYPDGSGYVGPHSPGRPPERGACGYTQLTHNTVDDALQRPVEEVGGLYTYQAIAAGTVLRAQVRLPAGLLPAGWQERLSGTWRLGRSRKDGYGLTDVTATVAPSQRGGPARQFAERGPGERLRVWLLSDLLVPDERLRQSTRPQDVARHLGTALGVTLAAVPDEPQERPRNTGAAEGGGAAGGVRFSEVSRGDSWHTRWGLPQISVLGLRAGSCLTFEVVAGTVTVQAVGRVECDGLGLRRAEGFGQLTIDDPLLRATFSALQTQGRPATAGEPGAPTCNGSGPSTSGLEAEVERDEADGAALLALAVLEDAAWREALSRRSPVLAEQDRDAVLGPDHGGVRASQLAGLLTLISHLSGPSDPAASAWLERLCRVPGEQRRRPWPDAVVEAVTRLLGEPGRVWELLRLPEDQLTASPDRAAASRVRLWPVAVRMVVEDCLTAQRRTQEVPGVGADS
ncbi:hypothetical protein JGS22_021985 [Streptomyces sp. P38-E01]|uniref:CRISPR type III-associated protein domain-containing protein n=1 Tax=Streptomyces tardus TaxID=2780544 RepID=A0A949NAV1_9ACTN|nr:RAMP superfamily CRISPR-associated protein [Streptomyces tardus]MBU7600228.1 hypothetical protein [Streptomyces tardus]